MIKPWRGVQHSIHHPTFLEVHAALGDPLADIPRASNRPSRKEKENKSK
jgi:hypothetical protein